MRLISIEYKTSGIQLKDKEVQKEKAICFISITPDGRNAVFTVHNQIYATCPFSEEIECQEFKNKGAHSSLITSLSVALNGSLLISTAEDGSINGWDFAAKELRFSKKAAHSTLISWLSVITHNSRSQGEGFESFLLFISGSIDGVVKLWKLSLEDFCLQQTPKNKKLILLHLLLLPTKNTRFLDHLTDQSASGIFLLYVKVSQPKNHKCFSSFNI
jgi:WD40 repeat protein